MGGNSIRPTSSAYNTYSGRSLNADATRYPGRTDRGWLCHRLTSAAVLGNDRCTGAKVDLSFLASCDFDTAKRKWIDSIEFGDVTADAVILLVKTVVIDKILKDPLGGQSLLERGNDQFVKRTTAAPRAGGRFGWFYSPQLVNGPGGRFGLVWAAA